MENPIEKGPERIPTKGEVMEVISRFAENAVLVRELSDEKGLYLLEVKVENKESTESTLYRYARRGEYPDHNDSSETIIHVAYYEGEVAVGGHDVAVYNSETNEWEVVE